VAVNVTGSPKFEEAGLACVTTVVVLALILTNVTVFTTPEMSMLIENFWPLRKTLAPWRSCS